ncbi:hypothetical protein [Chlamydia sp. 04-14]|uniref:hypothetical protein n=1 Tax=Chlamydia TaxID=810 RepID=UPI002FCAEF41
MFISKYATHLEFKEKTAHHPNWIKSGYIRDLESTESHRNCWIIIDYENLKASLLSSIPILGTIRGLARLFHVWSIKGSVEQINNTIIHTITGILETLGLGVVLLVFRITLTAIFIPIIILFCLCAILIACFKNQFEDALTKSLTSEVRIV